MSIEKLRRGKFRNRGRLSLEEKEDVFKKNLERKN